MSRREENFKYQKKIFSTIESHGEKEPNKTNPSINTESYEYYSQKITSENNNIEESDHNIKNRKIESSSINKEFNNRRKVLPAKNSIGNEEIQNSELKCTCNKNIVKNELKCTCPKINEQQCTCLKKNEQCTCLKTKTNEQNCTCDLIQNNKISEGKYIKKTGEDKYKKEIEKQKKNLTSTRYSNQASNVVEQNTSKTEKRTVIKTTIKTEEKGGLICSCPKETKINNIEEKESQKVINEENWGKMCVGQNNENLQILATERPELIPQCVHDMQVLQEKPVKILLPIKPNEIDFSSKLEIKGKDKKEEICPENIDTLNISKAYSTNIPKFDNLNIEKNEISCQRKKKEKIVLKIANEEMKVLVQKNFNKMNQSEVTTKMNVDGIYKPSWNELNEAIKTTKMNVDKEEKEIKKHENLDIENFAHNLFAEQKKFKDGLDIQNKEYNYKGKKSYSNDEMNVTSNDKMNYPAKYPRIDWNESALPMSGRPFTIENKRKEQPIEEDKENWNDKIKEKKEINIKMTVNVKKPKLFKSYIKPVIIKGQEIDWNQTNKEQNDSNILLESVKNNFVFSKENEVCLKNENDEIIVNDDYNIVEENYTRPIRANIKKIPDVSEESVCSDYDILKNIQKYDGKNYLFKNIVSESVKINGQKIIINDISGKYPRKIETYYGTNENLQKIKNDEQNYRNFNLNRKTETKVMKKEVHYSRIRQNESKAQEDINVADTQNRKRVFNVERRVEESQSGEGEHEIKKEMQNDREEVLKNCGGFTLNQKVVLSSEYEENSEKNQKEQENEEEEENEHEEIHKEENQNEESFEEKHNEEKVEEREDEKEEEKEEEKKDEESQKREESIKNEKSQDMEEKNEIKEKAHSQKISESPKSNKSVEEKKIMEQNEEKVNEKEIEENEIHKEEPIEQKVVIKEITYINEKGGDEGEDNENDKKIRYITLNRIEQEENLEGQKQKEELEKKSIEVEEDQHEEQHFENNEQKLKQESENGQKVELHEEEGADETKEKINKR